MRIIVSGGGSAGDISPILATVDALKSLDSNLEVLYVGQANGMEAKITRAFGVEFTSIAAGKFRRIHNAGRLRQVLSPTLGANIRDLFRTVNGLQAAWRLMRRWQPDAVFVKGGGVGLPVGLAAKLTGRPLVIHESNLIPGLGNQVLSRYATKIAVGFPVKSYKEWDHSRLVFTGNPVRAQITKAHRLEGLAKFNLSDKLPVVLVTGGSQGASEINDVVVAALPQLLSFCQVVHQTGEAHYGQITFELGRQEVPHRDRYHAYPFIMEDMPLALAAADVLVGRAGAGTIAEAAVLSKPTVLIPNTTSAGHQLDNAKALSRAGAARVISGDKLTAQRLVGEVRRILENREEQKLLARAISDFARPDAASELAHVVLAVAKEQGRGESHE